MSLILSLMLIGCIGGSTVTPEVPAGPVVDDEPAENAVRPPSPQVAKITNYKSDPQNTEGTISSEEIFDEAGNRVEYIGYDYYGSGEVDKRVKYVFDAKGRKTSDDDGERVETFEYDDDGRLARSSWSRPSDGAGSSEQHIYDEQGQESEIKYFQLDGTHDFSLVFERTYRGELVVEEKKFEKYTDGSSTLEMYWIQQSYDGQGRLTEKKNLRHDGKPINVERYRYDRRENLIETLEFDNDSTFATGKDTTAFNEFGEAIRSESFQCSAPDKCDRWQITTYEFDEYGHQVQYMTKQEHGEDMGERVVYTYAESKPVDKGPEEKPAAPE
ncbi:MAG: hypothetical protein HN348_07010 [Proteobacteria bacterium]|nr:hypothetical protein [Pseudomonadota bacterium]